MAEWTDHDGAMFPTLSPAQIARLAPLGVRRSVAEGEVILDPGMVPPGLYVVLEGRLEVVSSSRSGEVRITSHGPGQFTGEVNILTGRPSVVRTRAAAPSELLEVNHTALRQVVQTDPELGDVFLRAFVRRRARLIAEALGDLILLGSRYSAASLHLKEFLSRNAQPYTYLEVERDPGVQALMEHFAINPEDVPVLLCHDRPVLRNPSDAQVAKGLGFNVEIDESRVYDLVVVGAGPAGLAAAVYAASEGLDVLVLEGNAPGGQAGSSSRIENYLGFPLGVTGQDLAERAFVQAEKFGARVAVAQAATGLNCDRRPFSIGLTDGCTAQGHAVILATGAEYRKLPLPNITQFEGA